MKWQIVPREQRQRERVYDQELVDALINSDETIEVTEGFQRRLYQEVAKDNGYTLHTTSKKRGTTVIWFEKLEPDSIEERVKA